MIMVGTEMIGERCGVKDAAIAAARCLAICGTERARALLDMVSLMRISKGAHTTR